MAEHKPTPRIPKILDSHMTLKQLTSSQRRMPADVIVRRDYFSGLTFREMAKRYGVHSDTVLKFIGRRKDAWAAQAAEVAADQVRKIVLPTGVVEDGISRQGFVSLPRISIHVAALRDRGVNV